MLNQQLISHLIKNKWNSTTVSYGTKENPDPRDGLFRCIVLGNRKYKGGYTNSLVYEKMNKIKESLKTKCTVELVDTNSQVGGEMRVLVEHFDQFVKELEDSLI